MRSRNIKPGFFKNEVLAECDPLARILWQGLWCMADREGYLEYRPLRIKAEALPYDSADVEKFLEQLRTRRFIVVWCLKNGSGCPKPWAIQIPEFKKHQNPHKNEKPSEIAELMKTPEISGQLVKLPDDFGTNPADS